MDFDLKIFPAAQDDYRQIVERINTLPSGAAAPYFEQFNEMFEALREKPGARPVAKDLQLRLRGYRAATVKEYTAVYVLDGNTVEIRRILFTRRQHEGIL